MYYKGRMLMKNRYSKRKSNKGGKKAILSAIYATLILFMGFIAFLNILGKDAIGKDRIFTSKDSEAVVNDDQIDQISTGNDKNDYDSGTAAFDSDLDINVYSDLGDDSYDSIEDMAAEITVPTVEVAPVNDKNDPQLIQTAGFKVDISKFISVSKYNTDKKSNNSKKSDSKKSTGDKNTEKISYGIDVAKWQGVIDWKKVKESGVEFAIIRVGYRTQVDGTIYEDPYAEYNLQQAQANGIKIGVYFFSTAISKKEAIEEAKWVTDFIAPYPITYPVAYNCEGFTSPDSRQYKLTKDERTKIAMAFLDYVKEQGYEPMFYAAKNELEGNAMWNADKLSSKYKIWVAQYPDEGYTKDSRSTYSGEHAMWQYTNKGEVKGIKGAVDINIAYFAYDKTAKPKKNVSKEQVKADPYALIKFTEVNEIVTAKEITNLRTVPSSADPDTVVAVLKNGDTAKRIGIGDNGWSKLEYDGQILYAVSSYLTTDLTAKKPTPTTAPTPAGPVFKEVNEKVTAKEKTNLRSEPSTKSSDSIVDVLEYGDIALRTGISDNGWSRVEYNGKVLYAVSNYLTTDLKYKDNNKPSADNPEAGISFTAVNEKVTAKEVTNLRSVPSTASPDTVVAVLNKGDIAIRTGIGHNGWSRVEYKGQVLYAVTNYLVTVDDEDEAANEN